MYQNIFDSHAHYDDSAFDPDREVLLGETLPHAGIDAVVNVGNDYRSIDAGLALARRYDYFYCAVGHHPQTADRVRPDYLETLHGLLQLPKVVAIGEIGLDYYYETSPRETQKRVFREQLALAHETGMPVIIHSRDATADTLALLREFRPQGIVHCFSGSAETAREVVSLGMYLGFTGVLTFKNAKKALAAAAEAPLDRLLIETDSPYMAPVPHRGKRCDSTMLPHTLAALAAVKGIEAQRLADITNRNARQVYRIG